MTTKSDVNEILHQLADDGAIRIRLVRNDAVAAGDIRTMRMANRALRGNVRAIRECERLFASRRPSDNDRLVFSLAAELRCHSS